MEKRFLNEFNILRALACISVVLVHITSSLIFAESAGLEMKMVLAVVNRALKFTTPTFIFISGFLLFYIYQNRSLNYFRFWYVRLSTILVPYSLWTLFYYWYFIQQGIYVYSADFLIDRLMYANMVYHMYFVLIIVQFYLLFGVYRFLFQRVNSHLLILAFLVGNILFMKNVYFPYVDRFFMQYSFFFALGCYVAVNYQQIKEGISRYSHLLTVGYLAITLFYSYQFIYMSVLGRPLFTGFQVNLLWFVFCLVAIFFYLHLSILIEERGPDLVNKVLVNISNGSLYIYLGHPFALIIAQRLTSHYGVSSTVLSFILITGFVLGVTVPLAIMYRRLKTQVYRNMSKKTQTA